MAFFINRSKIQSQGIVLQKKAGYCVEKALLLPTVARSLGVSGRLRFSDVRNHLTTQQLKEIFIWSNSFRQNLLDIKDPPSYAPCIKSKYL